MTIELVMLSHHLILYCSLLLLPSIFPGIRVLCLIANLSLLLLLNNPGAPPVDLPFTATLERAVVSSLQKRKARLGKAHGLQPGN